MMRNKSLQWRATLLVSLLIAVICIIMNLLIYYTNTFYINDIDNYAMNNDSKIQVTLGDTPYDLDLSNLLGQYERKSSISGWIITFILTIIGGILTYLISGIFLRPLHRFTDEIEKIQIQNLSTPLPMQDAAPDIQRLTNTFNAMLHRLSESFQSQNRFIANAAHEFRTPLAIIRTKLELFQRLEEPTSTETQDFILTLATQTNRLSALIKTLLEMSELQTIEMKDSVNLADIVDEVLCDLDSLSEQRQITLSQETMPLVITGNDTLLSRLVYNLVENAIKYNRTGGSVHVTLARENSCAALRIKDSGSGIPENMWEDIMKPFYRVDKSRSRTMGGVGLGLALVHEIVELHHGKIEVESSSPSGTVMLVLLPL